MATPTSLLHLGFATSKTLTNIHLPHRVGERLDELMPEKCFFKAWIKAAMEDPENANSYVCALLQAYDFIGTFHMQVFASPEA